MNHFTKLQSQFDSSFAEFRDDILELLSDPIGGRSMVADEKILICNHLLNEEIDKEVKTNADAVRLLAMHVGLMQVCMWIREQEQMEKTNER